MVEPALDGGAEMLGVSKGFRDDEIAAGYWMFLLASSRELLSSDECCGERNKLSSLRRL